MSQDEWKSSINSLTKDIEELRKELLTERVKNLPDMIQNVVKTARQDMEARLKEIQENVREERVLIDDRIAQTDNRLKEIDEIINRIEVRDKRVGKFVDDYAGSLTEVKENVKVLNDDLKKFQGEMKSKFDSIRGEINKVTAFSGQIESAIKRSFETKREWGKVSTKFDRMVEKLKDMEKAVKTISKNEKDISRIAQGLDNFANEVTKTKDDLAEVNKNLIENLERVNELTKTYGDITGFREEMIGRMNFFKETASRLENLESMDKKMRKWVAENKKKLDETREASNKILELKDRLAVNMEVVEGFKRELNSVVARTNEMIGKVEANDVIINQFKDYLSKLSELSQYFGEVSGKVSELEHYFKDPKTWLSESIDEFVKESMNKMENKVDSATSSLEDARNYIRREFVQILIISKLTEVANAEILADMISNMRSLEFLVSEAVRMGVWNNELEKGVINTLSSTRDFWEARKPDLSDVLQRSIDTIESQIKEV